MKNICVICGTRFASSDLLKTHKRIHSATKHQCRSCIQSFTTASLLERHEMDVHGGNQKQSTAPPIDFSWIICPECGKTFKNKDDLIAHTSSVHNRPFLCSHCGKIFARKGNLDLHVKRHIVWDNVGKKDRC